MYNKHIQSAIQRIDSVKALVFVSPYENISTDKVLLKPVKCRYSYTLLPKLPREERTDIFYFLHLNTKIELLR